MHAALQFVLDSEIPSQHKAVLIYTLTKALRDQEADRSREQASGEAGEHWQEAELAELRTYLQSKIARSWQHADESTMHLAARLHRQPHVIRAKATELGLGVAVDFRLAKARLEPGDE